LPFFVTFRQPCRKPPTNGTYKYPEHFAQSFTALVLSIDIQDADEAIKIRRHNLPRVLEFVDAAAGFLDIFIHIGKILTIVRTVCEPFFSRKPIIAAQSAALSCTFPGFLARRS
jgi:hypothetical protein